MKTTETKAKPMTAARALRLSRIEVKRFAFELTSARETITALHDRIGRLTDTVQRREQMSEAHKQDAHAYHQLARATHSALLLMLDVMATQSATIAEAGAKRLRTIQYGSGPPSATMQAVNEKDA